MEYRARKERSDTTSVAQPHGRVTKGIHWLSALFLAYGYLKAPDKLSDLADPAFLRFEVLFTLLLGGLFLIRLVWTKGFAGATRLPQDAPDLEHIASRWVHYGLYGAVFAIVLTGLGIALGYVVPALGGLFLTLCLALHEGAVGLLPLLLAVHIGGAVWHKLVRRDKVLESMTGKLPF